jgi:hypothetical protein
LGKRHVQQIVSQAIAALASRSPASNNLVFG